MSNTTKITSAIRDAAAGAIGGVMGIIAGQPQDKIKARLQLDPDKLRYKSSLDCTRQIVKAEGVLSLWRGLSPPVISVLIQNSIVFGTYSLTCAILRKKQEKLSIPEVAFAGGFGGFVQSFVISPLELAKIRVQVDETPMPIKTVLSKKTPIGTHSEVLGPFQALSGIYARRGLPGIYRGGSLLLIREVPGYMMYFGSYEFFVREGQKQQTIGTKTTTFTAGGVAGVLSWMSVYPIDVLKTKFQADDTITLRMCVRELSAAPQQMFKGLGITVVRAFVVNGVGFLVYEYLR